MCQFVGLKMPNEHLLLWEHSGTSWTRSLNLDYFEKLSVSPPKETKKYLIRQNIFTFGLESYTSSPVTYYICQLCNGFVRQHEIKDHMLIKHTKEEKSSSTLNSTSCGSNSNSSMSGSTHTTGKLKKNSHKSKKKVVPPPAVPPPPLFVKSDSTPPVTIKEVEQMDGITAQSKEIQENLPREESTDLTNNAKLVPPLPSLSTINDIMPTTLNSSRVSSKQLNSHSTTLKIMKYPSILKPPEVAASVVSSSAVKLKETPASLLTSSSSLKRTLHQVAPSNSKKDITSSKRKRYRINNNAHNYDPDRNCGVLDSFRQPCMRALNCSSHTITERRSVVGRSKSIDHLLQDHKTSRARSKPRLNPPICLNAKPCSVKVENSLQFVELLYRNRKFRCEDNPRWASRNDDMTNIKTEFASNEDGRTFKNVKLTGCDQILPLPTIYLPMSPDREQNSAEVPSSAMPTLYNIHPKPLTVSTPSVRRVGHTYVLQQAAAHIERQRLDLQAVVNQHKQLKLSSPNKPLLVLNSNSKSILKSNIKNNAKTTISFKRSVDKNSIGDLKHMKVINSDMNGYIINTEFSDSNDIQIVAPVQEKVSLLK